jgi:putative heme-binding domain-containing protein
MNYPNTYQAIIKSWSCGLWLLPLLAALAVRPLQAQDPAEASGSGLSSAALQVAEGFQAELVYEVAEAFGSWVSLTTSPDGLIASDQYGKLYRIRPGDNAGATRVSPIPVELGHAQGLLWAFDSLYVMAHPRNGQPGGLYRVTDADHDGELDTVKLLRKIEGIGEHGPHAVIAGPDSESLYVCAGNHTNLTDVQTSRVPRNWQEDNLIRRMWDPGGHAVGMMAPGGWICRTDPQGQNWELVSIGYRNQYDIAFDVHGELFTYDADMEWDIGTPWYRPTRVCHVTPGSEFGWRGGDAKWPVYFPDSVPPVLDIGPGSPTGIVFGTGAAFPPRYQRALFIADWSFGFIYAIHLQPDGATWKAEKELFCSAPALQVTDMIVHDGDLYFAIGGRRTQSALFRIRALPWQASESEAADGGLTDLQQLRRRVESGPSDGTDPVDFAWPFLNHPDRAIRYAARIHLEQQPLDEWLPRALAAMDPQTRLESLLAACRHTDANPRTGSDIIDALSQHLEWQNLSELQRLHLLRVCSLLLTRLATADTIDGMRKTLDEMFSPRYPASSVRLNRELSRLLIACEAEDVIPKTLDLLDAAGTQEEQIHYVMCLRVLQDGWNREWLTRYLQWFVRSAVFQGGKSFAGYLHNARKEFLEQMNEADKQALAALIDVPMTEQDPYAELKTRPVVKRWTVADLLPAVENMQLAGRDLENGKRVFAVAQCYKCHQFAGSGGIVGPDLTGLSRRYTDQYLLETLIDPNKEISSQYQATLFELEDGRMVTGRVANLNKDNYMVQEDMIAPGKLTNINRHAIVASRPSRVSPMPEQLLDTFEKQDILDLIAYLRSADP